MANPTTEQRCLWCNRPKSEWTGTSCPAPDGDGHSPGPWPQEVRPSNPATETVTCIYCEKPLNLGKAQPPRDGMCSRCRHGMQTEPHVPNIALTPLPKAPVPSKERISDARLAEIVDYYSDYANHPSASGWRVAIVCLLRELQERRAVETLDSTYSPATDELISAVQEEKTGEKV